MLVLQTNDNGSRRRIQLPDPTPPNPREDEVVVRVEHAALNRIDKLMLVGEVPPQSTKQILGGEGAGIIHALGSEVENLSLGQRVSIFPYSGCRTCQLCIEGNPTMCSQARLTGVNSPGTYQSYFLSHALDVSPVREGVSSSLAAVASTLAVAWHVLVCRGGLVAGESVAVAPITSGVGAACGELAHHLGAEVIGVSRSVSFQRLRYRPEWLNEIWAWDETASVKSKRVDLAVDAAGSTLGFLHQRLKTHGRIVSVGAHTTRTVPLDLWRIFTREQDLRGSHGCHRGDMERAVILLDKLDESALIDSAYPVSDFASAFNRLDEQGKFGKVLLTLRSNNGGEKR